MQEAFPAHGWVSEEAGRRLRFITPFARRLQTGETIAVSTSHGPRPDDNAPRVTYRVLSVSPYDNALTLVECAQA
jgi:hypothetical protein